MNKRIKLSICIGVVILAMAFLFAQGFKASGGVGMYLTIEEALTGFEDDGKQFIQMEGKVVAGSVRYASSKPSLVFDLTDGKSNMINVIYNDVKPDNFDSGYPVIVEGRFSGNKQFVADKLMVKCPSKYEEEAKE